MSSLRIEYNDQDVKKSLKAWKLKRNRARSMKTNFKFPPYNMNSSIRAFVFNFCVSLFFVSLWKSSHLKVVVSVSLVEQKSKQGNDGWESDARKIPLAVCIVGQVRTGACRHVMQSQRDLLVLRLVDSFADFHVFLVLDAGDTDPSPNMMRRLTDRESLSAFWGHQVKAFATYQANKTYSKVVRRLPKNCTFSARNRVVSQHVMWAECGKLVRVYAQKNHLTDAAILKVRPDILFARAYPYTLAEILNASPALWAPKKMRGLGVSDGVLIAPSKVADSAIFDAQGTHFRCGADVSAARSYGRHAWKAPEFSVAQNLKKHAITVRDVRNGVGKYWRILRRC